MIEEGLTTCLGSAVEEFLSALDPVARASATGGAGFSVVVYTFLVYPTHGTYRRQFAEIFPGLVPKVVNAGGIRRQHISYDRASWGRIVFRLRGKSCLITL